HRLVVQPLAHYDAGWCIDARPRGLRLGAVARRLRARRRARRRASAGGLAVIVLRRTTRRRAVPRRLPARRLLGRDAIPPARCAWPARSLRTWHLRASRAERLAPVGRLGDVDPVALRLRAGRLAAAPIATGRTDRARAALRTR